jgi:hypothetical protein
MEASTPATVVEQRFTGTQRTRPPEPPASSTKSPSWHLSNTNNTGVPYGP